MIVASAGMTYTALMRERYHSIEGFTILEFLIVIAIVTVLAAIIINFIPYRNIPRESILQLQGEMTRTRAEAMSNTLSMRILNNADNTMSVQSAIDCSLAENTGTTVNWKPVRTITFDKSVTITTNNSSKTPDLVACYSPRGMADNSRIMTITNSKKTYTLELALGGGVQTNVQ